MYVTVNGTQVSKLRKYCLEHFIIVVNYLVYKEEIRSKVLIVRHSSYTALV